MIVNSKATGWEIFSHSAHGLLAGKIANELRKEYKDENWVATLTAIIEHDDRQLNFREKDYLTKIGTPQNFLDEKRKVKDVIKRSKRLLEQSREKSSWITILVIHHLQFLYKELANQKKSIAKFLSQLAVEKEKLSKINRFSKKYIETIYQIMVFADRCSLILTQDLIPTMNRKLEINTSINGDTYYIFQLQSGSITISPWIFEKDSFSLTCEYKLLTNSSFDNNASFKKSLQNSDTQIKKWEFSPSN